MTVSKPPFLLRNAARRVPIVVAAAAFLAVVALGAALPLSAQDTSRHVRLLLRDKGVAERNLTPEDPLYAAATAHLTPRALARRARTLPVGRRVSTADLPLHQPYLAAITGAGATILQSSRWLNTVMVRADSLTIERLRGLPFVVTTEVVKARDAGSPVPYGKLAVAVPAAHAALDATADDCLADAHGLAAFQNRFMGLDQAHRMGIAGEGVLVGVLDAGFERRHRAFAATRIEAEYDFVHGNANTADEPEDSLAESSQEEHGTMVLSLIGATWRDTLVGGAPRAAFMLAKTEDLRYERHIEEDNFVAGLEWLEAQGVDITNTSLGYTGFDAPERSHTYDELNGHSVGASRAVNRATELGVLCVVSAGNDGRGAFIYVGVPAEADSAMAVAAVDSLGRVAGFSSRGRPGHEPPKPDVAGYGVGNWAAHPSSPLATRKSQGTSFAGPMTAAVAAVVLSAAPELRPWELRSLLQRTAHGAAAGDHDTALGAGIVNAGDALRELARTRLVVGVPAISASADRRTVAIAAGVLDTRPRSGEGSGLDSHVSARIRWGDTATGPTLVSRTLQPVSGIARWSFRSAEGPMSGPLVVEILDAGSGLVARRHVFTLDDDSLHTASTICATPALATLDEGTITAWPNPFTTLTRLAFELESDATISLTIFNSRGEEVARLLDDVAAGAGPHSVTFDARGLPSGSYHALLRIGGETRDGGMIYLP